MTKILVIVAVLVIVSRVSAWRRSRALGSASAGPAAPTGPGFGTVYTPAGVDLSQRFAEIAAEMRAGNTSRAMALLSRRDTDWDAVRHALDAAIRAAAGLGMSDPGAASVAFVLSAPGGQNVLIDEIVRTASEPRRIQILGTLQRVTAAGYVAA
jgi:hypothetical protein